MYLALPESITNEQSQGCSRGTPYRKTQKATFQKDNSHFRKCGSGCFLMRSVSRPWKGLDQCIQYGYFSSFFFRQEELFVSSYDVFPSLRLTKMLCFFFDPLEHIGVGEHQVNEIVVASLAVPE